MTQEKSSSANLNVSSVEMRKIPSGSRLTQRELFRLRKWPAASLGLYMVIMAIAAPFMFYIRGSLDGYFTANNVFPMGSVLFGILFALEGYGYLQDRRRVDFYCSQPVTRRQMMVGIFVNSMLTFVILFTLTYYLGAGLNTALGRMSGSNLAATGPFVLNMLTLYYASFSLTALAVLITGKTLVSVLAAFFFFVYEIVFRNVIGGYIEVTCESYTGSTLTGIQRIFTSPLGWSDGRPVSTMVCLIMGTVYLLLTMPAAVPRKNESAGNSPAFPWVRHVVKFAVAVLTALTAGLTVLQNNGRILQPTASFMAVFFALAACFVMESIFAQDIRAFGRHILEDLVAALACVALIAGIITQCLSYDRWLPDKDQIESAAVYPEDSFNYSIIDYGEPSDNDFFSQQVLKMKVKDTGSVLGLAENGISNQRDQDSEKMMYVYRIRFTLKDDKIAQRKYYITLDALDKYMEPISKTQEFKAGMFGDTNDALVRGELDRLSVAFTSIYDSSIYDSAPDGSAASRGKAAAGLYDGLKAAVAKDTAGWDYSYASSHPAVGLIYIYDPDGDAYEKIPVYMSFTNTIDFLRQHKMVDFHLEEDKSCEDGYFYKLTQDN